MSFDTHRVSLDMIGDVHFHSKPLGGAQAAKLVHDMDSAANAAGRCVVEFPLEHETIRVNMNHATVWYPYETKGR